MSAPTPWIELDGLVTLGPRIIPEVNDGAFGVAKVVASVELLTELPVGPSAGFPVELFVVEVVAPPAAATLPDVIAPVLAEGVIAGLRTSAPTPWIELDGPVTLGPLVMPEVSE